MQQNFELLTDEASQTSIPAALAGLFDESIMRERLLRAMCESLSEKGFADTVVADVVGRARVSRRTFYAEFSDRGECLLALCEHCTTFARTLIDAAADPTLPWESQVENAIDSYIVFLTLSPRLTHAMHFEIYALGERGLEVQQAVNHAFATQVLELAARAHQGGADIREPTYATAAALVGAIFQLLQTLEGDVQRITVEEARAAAIGLVLDSGRPFS
jgi:AcrR family transcriptional regulator